MLAQSARRAQESECDRDRTLQRLRQQRDTAPVIAVCRVPCDESECEYRGELRESDESEAERAVRELVSLPRHGNRQHLVAERGYRFSDPETRERRRLHVAWRYGSSSAVSGVVDITAVSLSRRYRGALLEGGFSPLQRSEIHAIDDSLVPA